MFQKILVANRGEIAIRAIRAAHELGVQTVAVFPYEIGERGHPVRAYLDPEAIVAAAVSAGANAVYPGYGFLSENPDLAEACQSAGVTFIGPPTEVLELAGNKASAIAAAKAAGVPTLRSVEPSADVDELVAASDVLTYPLFVKIAPAPHLPRDIRKAMCADAVRFAESIGYSCAGTVEFLLGADGRYVFIEMNPRIQVEHTVTEEVTDDQSTIKARGFALQCRITTEDPSNGFRPDTGTITSPMSALVAATNHSARTTGLDIDAVNALEPYWEATRRLYARFESGLPAPTGRVYRHDIPGGQLSNLRQQAVALGLGEKFEQIEDMYAAANDILGNVVKVTPSSKVVGDLALHLVAAGADTVAFGDPPGLAGDGRHTLNRLLLFGIEAIGDADERGIRNVLGTINGQLRPTEVRDRSVDSKVTASEKAETGNPQHVAVPFAGFVHALVAEGDAVEAGQTVATIEAMKMEASITTANAGTVARLVIGDTRQAEGGDLLLVLT